MKYQPPFWEDPKKTEFESVVNEIDGDRVVLEETYFHPEEGGQPADKGTINGYKVKDIQKVDGTIIHWVEEHDLQVGDIVEGEIDEEFRYYCMRAHTGAHVVYGAGRKVMGDISYAGFDIGEEKARIDFETETYIDNKKLLRLEELCNRVILENRPVRWRVLDRKEVRASKEIAFAKEIPEGEKVRIIEVEDWDKGICSGTHLENTIEVGRIRIEGKKKLQEGVTRILFSIAEEALDRDYKDKRSILRVTESLETSIGDLPKKIRSIQRRLEDMEEKVEELESEKIEQQMEDFDKYQCENFDLLIQTVSTEDTETLSHKAKEDVGSTEVMVIINERETLSAIVGVGEDIDLVSANNIIQSASQEFGGGGGGTDHFAQGGGFSTDTRALRQYFIDLIK
ncbi:MAG: DHHA1 domain-containing protein [Candidatus Saliniplasma sp.]